MISPPAARRVLAALSVVSATGGALAADRPHERVRLSYALSDGAADCPDAAAVQRAVAERLGYDPFDASAEMTIVVSISRGKKGLAADVERRDRGGQSLGSRRIEGEGEGCDELASATALAISIAVDPAAAMALPAPAVSAPPDPPAGQQASAAGPPVPEAATPRPPAEPPPPPAPPSAPPDRPSAEEPPPSEPFVFAAGAGVLGAAGSAPNPAFGVLMHLQIGRSFWSIGAEGRADLPSSGGLPGGGSVSAALLTARLVPCLHWAPALACAVLSAGALVGSSSQIGRPGQDTTPFASAGLRGGAELTVAPRLRLRGQLDLEATLTRTTLRVGGTPVWTTPPVTGALSAIALVTFP